MKQRETILKNIVANLYGLSSIAKTGSVAPDKNQYDELKRVYQLLGGRLAEVPFKFGSWDIVTPNFIIELDEEQHFNRYRKQTLESDLYENWHLFDLESYRLYCTEYESICLSKARHGGYWQSDSTILQFGEPGLYGDLSGKGSPRWKQRAFYDYCRDLFGWVNKMPVYRLSVYDMLNINGRTILLGTALDRNMQKEVIALLNQKIQ